MLELLSSQYILVRDRGSFVSGLALLPSSDAQQIHPSPTVMVVAPEMTKVFGTNMGRCLTEPTLASVNEISGHFF